MRKIFVLVACMVLFVGVSYATEATTAYTGVADFTGKGEANFSFTLKNVANDSEASSLTWSKDDAFITGSTISWVRCQQYAVVAATITKANCTVYMYQKNKESSVYKAENPRYNAYDPVKKSTPMAYSGLVNKATKGGAYRGYIPVAYSLVPTKDKNITFDGVVVTTTTRADRYFTDAADHWKDESEGSNFDKNYGMIAYSNVGVVFGAYDEEGAIQPWSSPEVKDNTAYIYFFGGFSDIRGNDVYGTDKLLVIQDFE